MGGGSTPGVGHQGGHWDGINPTGGCRGGHWDGINPRGWTLGWAPGWDQSQGTAPSVGTGVRSILQEGTRVGTRVGSSLRWAWGWALEWDQPQGTDPRVGTGVRSTLQEGTGVGTGVGQTPRRAPGLAGHQGGLVAPPPGCWGGLAGDPHPVPSQGDAGIRPWDRVLRVPPRVRADRGRHHLQRLGTAAPGDLRWGCPRGSPTLSHPPPTHPTGC